MRMPKLRVNAVCSAAPRRGHRPRCSVYLILSTLLLAAPALAQYSTSYVPSVSSSIPSAVNNAGSVVGQMWTPQAWHAFLYAGGVLRDLTPGSSLPTQAVSITNSGTVLVKTLFDSYFVESDGTVWSVPMPPDGNWRRADAISSSGYVCGRYTTAAGAALGFVFNRSTGAFQTISPPEGFTATGYGVSDVARFDSGVVSESGAAAGTLDIVQDTPIRPDLSYYAPAIFMNGTTTMIGGSDKRCTGTPTEYTCEIRDGWVQGVSSLGVVVGFTRPSTVAGHADGTTDWSWGSTEAWIYENGVRTVVASGAELSAINDDGLAVGQFHGSYAFTYRDGVFERLNFDWYTAGTKAISANGIITGYVYGRIGGGQASATIWSPPNAAASITVGGATAAYRGNVTLSARLTDAANQPLTGKTIAFRLFDQPVGSAVTDASGTVSAVFPLPPRSVGTYAGAIAASFAGDSAADPASGTADLTITQATPILSWSAPAPIVYGTTLSSAQFRITAQYGDEPVAGELSVTPSVGTLLDAGNRTLHATFVPADSSFSSVAAEQSVHVLPALLTIRADDQTREYGMPNPPFSGQITGLVNGDEVTATYATTATLDSPAGIYAVHATAVDPQGRLFNYDLQTLDGTLAVTKASPIFSAIDTTPVIVGAPTAEVSGRLSAGSRAPSIAPVTATFGSVTTTASVGVDGTFAVTVPTASLAAGTYLVTFSYPGDANFGPAAAGSSVVVTYGVAALYDQSAAKNAGSTIAVKLMLTDIGGRNLSDAQTAVNILDASLVGSSATVVPADAGSSNPGGQFRFTSFDGRPGYLYTWQTKNMSSGTWVVRLKAGNDPLVHSVQFTLK